LAAIPARYALERGDWQQALQLQPTQTPFPYTDAITWFARGLGSAQLGDSKAAYGAAASLDQIHSRLLASGETYWALQVQIQQREVRAWALIAEGKKSEALREMESAAQLEDGTEKSAVTPGPIAPARELLGEMLLATHQPSLALGQFEATLKKEPGRFRALYGAAQAARLANHIELSHSYFRELLRICEHADQPGRPELVEARNAISANPPAAH
jgi:tetratricopeptide (TPR) repeat protein